MYIKRVVLENLRGFRQLDLDFERPDGRYSGWAVITGDNAADKTAFLKAIALVLRVKVTSKGTSRVVLLGTGRAPGDDGSVRGTVFVPTHTVASRGGVSVE